MPISSNPSYTYKSISASTQISGTPAAVNTGEIAGIVCSASTAGIIKIFDSNNGATGNVILDQYPLTAAAPPIILNAAYSNGLYIQLVSGTATFTVTYV